MHRANTTFDVYLGGRLPPIAPDTAGAAGFLRDEWARGNWANKGDRTFFFTAVLEAALGVNMPDAYPAGVGATTVWVPDHSGAAYTVVFVERERAFRGGDFERVYLIRGYVVAITVRDVNLFNVYPSTTLLEFNDADGFIVSQPAANQARVSLLHASTLQVGIVDLGTQSFAGYKDFTHDGIGAKLVNVPDNGNEGVTLASFLASVPTYYVAPGLGYVYVATFSDHRRGVLLRNAPTNPSDITAVFLEQSNAGLDHGRLVLYQNNSLTTPAFAIGTVSGGVETIYEGISGTFASPSSVTVQGGLVTSVNAGTGGGLTTTISYTQPGGATGTLTFTNGLLTGSS